MRILKFPPWVMFFSSAILVFIFGLLALGAFSSSFFHGTFGDLSEELEFEERIPLKGSGYPPIFAYLISGTGGETDEILRLLKAVYHPRNRYLLYLDAGASHLERSRLAFSVQSEIIFKAFRNIDVVRQAYPVDPMGASAVATILHAAAVLLRISMDWDWFITLSASDYPIVSQDVQARSTSLEIHKNPNHSSAKKQSAIPMNESKMKWKRALRDMGCSLIIHDRERPSYEQFLPPNPGADLLHVFTSLSRDLNFIYHTNITTLKEYQKMNQVVVDPNLYLLENTKIFQTRQTHATPDAFKLVTGSPWFILSRPFMEYCVQGWDNLPRKLLMFFTNVANPLEAYFQTVICNSPHFQNTTVNYDLRYIVRDTVPLRGPSPVNQSRYKGMIESGAAFAGRLKALDPLIPKVDEHILRRPSDEVVPGKWCLGPPLSQNREEVNQDLCSRWGSIDAVDPGPYGKRLKSSVSKLVAEKRQLGQCDPW